MERKQFARFGLTLGHLFLAVTPPDTDTVDNVALLGLVTQAASLVGAGRAGCAVDDVQLTVLPAAVVRIGRSELWYEVHSEVGRTERGGGNGGHPTASSCTALRYTCMRPCCRLEGRGREMSVRCPHSLCQPKPHPIHPPPIHPVP